MTAAQRSGRVRAADALCATAYAEAGCPDRGVALVAVGGYGRGELAPYSDLDVMLVHGDEVAVDGWAAAVWYPLWDSGAAVDHAVRSTSEVSARAAADVRVALGLLDLRHLAGDPDLTLRLRTTVLAQWRRRARDQLPQLRGLVAARVRRCGELAHAATPDLKESLGGLRDTTVLEALVATWLVDVPHTELERCHRALLDLRDAVHTAAGRRGDRVEAELWPEVAPLLELADGPAAQRHARELGRRMAHLSRLTWRRTDAALQVPARVTGVRRPQLTPIAPGLATSRGEVVLDPRARPAQDPDLLLRAAAEAAERDLVPCPATIARLLRTCPPLPDPWPDSARNLFVRLLASGPGLLTVWETLDETGALAALLPEWESIRLLPHVSPVHRFTVDRHLVETCMEAAGLIRRVARPDVLMVAALLHDIGKGRPGEHSLAGEPIARAVARRIGFAPPEVESVAGLVRRHLLLPQVATTRDLDDPATVALVTDRIGGPAELDLLHVLAEADARATAPQAWSTWRAGLVCDLVERCRAAMGDPVAADRRDTFPVPRRLPPGEPVVEVEDEVEDGAAGATVRVCARDRPGLLADVAAMLAIQRVPVRSARARSRGGVAVSEWHVEAAGLDPALLRQRLRALRDGRPTRAVPPRSGRAGAPGPPPSVRAHATASERATVLEVREADRPGLVHAVCAALAGVGLTVSSAHLGTLGPQAVDTFYVHEPGRPAPLAGARAAAAVHAVRSALAGPDGT